MRIQDMLTPDSFRKSMSDAPPKTATKSAGWNWWVEADVPKPDVCVMPDFSITMAVQSIQCIQKTTYGGVWQPQNRMKFVEKWPNSGLKDQFSKSAKILRYVFLTVSIIVKITSILQDRITTKMTILEVKEVTIPPDQWPPDLPTILEVKEVSILPDQWLLDLLTIDLLLDHLTDPRLLNDPMLLKILGTMREVDLMMMKGILGMMMRILLVWMTKKMMMGGVILVGNKDWWPGETMVLVSKPKKPILRFF